ncbi:MAG: PIN domain-containing protein [Candidatus Electrothrix sp. AUS1_2]|nr:PIN domain-containing protein [Candidatus Electrothrix sp. AUS1_2]
MADFVVDNSIVMSWCFDDEEDDYADTVLTALETMTAGVPAVWPLEVANVLLVAERRKRLTTSDSIRFLELLRELSLEVIQEAPQRGTSEIMVLAREQQLSSYDASYLDLAMRKGLPLATLDTRLRNAAEKCGVAFFELPKTDKPE